MDNLSTDNLKESRDEKYTPSRRQLQMWCMELEERLENLEKRVEKAEQVTDLHQKIGG